MATKNIEDLCRICVQESHSYKHIYSHCIDDAYLYEVINALCHIDICESDGLPDYICRECYDKVLCFHKFQKTCHDGKAALISIRMKYSQEMTIDPSKIKTEVFMDEIEFDGYTCGDREPERQLHQSAKTDEGGGTRGVPEERRETNEGRLSPRDENERGAAKEGNLAAGERNKTGAGGCAVVVPVGLVKCPREEPMAEEVPILRVASRSSLDQTKVPDGGVVSKGGGNRPRADVPQLPESVLPSEGENYQIGRTRPTPLRRSPADHSDRTGNHDRAPVDRSEDGFIIKRIYDGIEGREAGEEEEESRTAGFPFMGRANEKSRTGYKCPHCGKSISRRFDFESHLRIHSGIKPFECHICHATFNLKKRLKAHMNVHSAMKLFICAYCQRKFKSKDALRLHIYVHAGERLPDRPSKPSEAWCAVCGVSVLESCLAYHMRTHTRDLDCQVCGLTCRDADDLTAHRRVHDHEKKFQCTKCGKRYGLKGNLVQHMMIHTNDKRFACKTCGRKFYTGSRLRRHEQVHSSERNVVCSICGRAFKTKYYLHQHLKTHQGGEAPYMCLTCGQRYKWQGDLKKHCRVKNHLHN